MEITDKDFWVNYWKNIKIPVTVNYQFKNDRVIAQTIKQYVPKAAGEQWAFEVGCAPGKWLIFLNKELDYNVVGYEYIDTAAEKTKENLVSQNISQNQFNVITGDFNKNELKDSYAVVLSLGFIEHFTDLNSVMLKHLSLVDKNGYLVLGVPNLKGINYYLQKVIDRYLVHKMLPSHNLEAMDVEKYVDFAKANGLKLLFVGYVGGFERGLFFVNEISNVPLRLLMKAIIRVFGFLFNNTKCRFFNSYIMAIMQK